MNTRPPSDDLSSEDLLAAEYVLGVLDAEGRRAARERLEREPAFADEVARWESWFSPWLQRITPVEPPASAWARIRTTLWERELPSRDGRIPPPAMRSLWDNLGFWRGLAAGGFAVATASIVVLLFALRQLPPPAPAPIVVAPAPSAAPMVVSLRQDDGSAAYTATMDPDRGTIVLVPVQLQGDPTLSPELWLIPSGDKPHSLGMVRRADAMVLTIPLNLRAAAHGEALLAISLEPAGSGPHAAPTGPVVAKGSLIRL